jgi:hypothetical protein
LSDDSSEGGRVRRFFLPGALESTPDLRDDAVLWEIEELFEDERGQDLADGFL